MKRRDLLLGSAGAAIAALVPHKSHARILERPDLARHFESRGLTGTIAILDVAKDDTLLYAPDRAKKRFVPASTFKIANALIALETGAIRDETEMLPYGGAADTPAMWARDMNLRDAMAASNVPIFQGIARKVGLAAYSEWLAKLQYGNADPGKFVDRFWLDGPLEISAIEQVSFIAKLARGELPLSERSQRLVRDAIRLSSRNGANLHGKTGWAASVTPRIGWLTGYVEKAGAITAFSLNIDMASMDQAPLRQAIAEAVLSEIGVW